MKAKILDKYISVCQQYKIDPKKQVEEYLSDKEIEENTIFNTEAVNLIFPGNISINFNRKLQNQDVHPILSSFMSFGNNIMIVDLSYNLLDSKAGVYLQKLFEITENIVSINLRGNQLNDVAIAKFFPSLVKKPYLKSIDLNTNHISNIGVMKINELLYHNSELEILNLGHNLYDWDGILALMVTLKAVNKTLKILNIDDPSFKHFDQDFFHHIGKMLYSNRSLDKLSLRFNKIRSEGSDIIFTHLKNNIYLTTLDLSCNQICLDGMNCISILLGITTSLRSLNLGSNQIHDKGAKILALGIANNKSLQFLDITNNGIREEGLIMICDAFELNESIRIFKIFKGNFWSKKTMESYKSVIDKKSDIITDFEIYYDQSFEKEIQIAHVEIKNEDEEEFLVPS